MVWSAALPYPPVAMSIAMADIPELASGGMHSAWLHKELADLLEKNALTGEKEGKSRRVAGGALEEPSSYVVDFQPEMQVFPLAVDAPKATLHFDDSGEIVRGDAIRAGGDLSVEQRGVDDAMKYIAKTTSKGMGASHVSDALYGLKVEGEFFPSTKFLVNPFDPVVLTPLKTPVGDGGSIYPRRTADCLSKSGFSREEVKEVVMEITNDLGRRPSVDDVMEQDNLTNQHLDGVLVIVIRKGVPFQDSAVAHKMLYVPVGRAVEVPAGRAFCVTALTPRAEAAYLVMWAHAKKDSEGDGKVGCYREPPDLFMVRAVQPFDTTHLLHPVFGSEQLEGNECWRVKGEVWGINREVDCEELFPGLPYFPHNMEEFMAQSTVENSYTREEVRDLRKYGAPGIRRR